MPGSRSLRLLVAAWLLTVACARHRLQDEDSSLIGNAAEVSIIIENRHWSDIRIYLIRDGVKDRLGMVTAATTRTFLVPYRRLGPGGMVRLLADPVGGAETLVSDDLWLQPGQGVSWTLQASLGRSSVLVF